MTEKVDRLAEHLSEMDNRLDQLLDDSLDRRAPDKVVPRLSRRLGLRRARTVHPMAVPPIPGSSFIDRVEEAADKGLISGEQETRLKVSDLVFHGYRKSDGARVWCAVEVSAAVSPRDIDSASESASVLRTVFGEDAEAAVMGLRVRLQDRRRADLNGVVVMIEDDSWP